MPVWSGRHAPKSLPTRSLERPIAPENARTDRRLGLILMIPFLVMVFSPILIQFFYGVVKLGRVQELELFRGRDERPDGTMETMLEHMEEYEDELAEEAIVAKLARPYVQWTTLHVLGQGNEKVVIGRDGWLFFRPGLLYPTGPGFRSHYVQADAAVEDWDPLPAILDYGKQLAERGIELVLVPLPTKPQIYPEKLTGLYDLDLGPPANPHTDEFYRELRDNGIHVVDLAPVLWEAKARGQLYLTLDTHWTPLAMSIASKALAEELKGRFEWLVSDDGGKGQRVEYTTRKEIKRRHGDNYYQLDLPEWSKVYPEHDVIIEQVIDPQTGEPVRRSHDDAEILLLGDSFTNIYSTEEPNERGMRWGAHAGFGEHMMLELGRPINVIAVNGGAPTDTRKQASKKGALRKKRLVVWSFATRELIVPDTKWELVPIVELAAAITEGPLVLIGEIMKTSKAPVPRVDPYPEAVTFTKYKVIEVESGTCAKPDVIAYEWVMRDFKLTDAADYKMGDVHKLTLMHRVEKEKRDPSIAAVKQLDDLNDLRPDYYWVVEMEKVEK